MPARACVSRGSIYSTRVLCETPDPTRSRRFDFSFIRPLETVPTHPHIWIMETANPETQMKNAPKFFTAFRAAAIAARDHGDIETARIMARCARWWFAEI